MSIKLIVLCWILLLHWYIVIHEIKYKKIYNKYLIWLWILNIIYLWNNWNHLEILPLLIKVLLIWLWIFWLYKLKIWPPSILKYIFVSSLFFLWYLELSFISNIFFTIFLYIIWYFIYYYWKLIFSIEKSKWLYISTIEKIKWDIHNWKLRNNQNLAIKTVLFILWFFAIFILIRLIRIFLQWELNILSQVFHIYNISINTFVLILIFLFFITYILHQLYHKYLAENFKYLIIIITFTIFFLIYEFIYDYEFISEHLYRILTFLLILFFFSWVLINMWKYLFFDADAKIINYQELKPWDIIDKKIISSYLIWQKSLENDDIESFIKSISSPIWYKKSIKLKQLIKKNSDYQIKQGNIKPPNIIKIYNKFLFTPFIFISFFLTFIIQENILIAFIIYIFKKIMWLEDFF